ncbi:fimbrillin family protein [Odoribacter sp. OttesenSCG-928-J03]|nr:fimbrillin family protein [Odoribacter sp. OttesenSCG-928-J03]MDL2282943.1 fimbrillin family protein [Odoribacter sp. OttesenSCG-928-G04]
MRRKINTIFTLIVALVLWTGCHNEFLGSADENSGRAINFSCTTVSSRAKETNIENMASFRISAGWNKSENEYVYGYMDEQLVKKDANNDWVYSPVRDMPSYGTIDFFAYSPANASVSDFSINETTHDQISLTYDVTNDLEIQQDFMVASAIGIDSPTVPLNFRHALSSIKVKLKSATDGNICLIKEIKLLNFYRRGVLTGTISGNQTVWAWSNQNTMTTYTISLKEDPYVADAYEDVSDPTIGPLMILPQSCIGNGAYIYIVYDVRDTDNNKLYDNIIAAPIDEAVYMGERYVFQIDLD